MRARSAAFAFAAIAVGRLASEVRAFIVRFAAGVAAREPLYIAAVGFAAGRFLLFFAPFARPPALLRLVRRPIEIAVLA